VGGGIAGVRVLEEPDDDLWLPLPTDLFLSSRHR
jgi:hypothetical protein